MPKSIPSLLTDIAPRESTGFNRDIAVVGCTYYPRSFIELFYSHSGNYQSFPMTIAEAEQHARNILAVCTELREQVEQEQARREVEMAKRDKDQHEQP